jgi:hypothetical protein
MTRYHFDNCKENPNFDRSTFEQQQYDISQKISKANKGKKCSEESKKKMSLAKKGKPSNRKGVKLSEETKLKMSLAKKKKK